MWDCYTGWNATVFNQISISEKYYNYGNKVNGTNGSLYYPTGPAYDDIVEGYAEEMEYTFTTNVTH